MPKTPRYAPPRVAAVQMTSGPDVDRNLAQARELLDEALKQNCNIVAFPENMLLLTNDAKAQRAHAQTLRRGPLIETLQEWAAEGDVWLLAGSVPVKAPGSAKIYNTSLLFTPEGEIKARYDKMHLFDVHVRGDQSYQESKTVKAGEKPVCVETPWGKLGLSICYDLRFPELYRKLAKAGADAIFVPAAFTKLTGQAHWDVLTRARAIENQCYVIAPAQTGEVHPGRECFGHARIVDPWGRVVAERNDGIGVVWADLDYAGMAKIREDLPALKHRRIP